MDGMTINHIVSIDHGSYVTQCNDIWHGSGHYVDHILRCFANP